MCRDFAADGLGITVNTGETFFRVWEKWEENGTKWCGDWSKRDGERPWSPLASCGVGLKRDKGICDYTQQGTECHAVGRSEVFREILRLYFYFCLCTQT